MANLVLGIYQNTENFREVELIEVNDKAKNVTVQTQDGLPKSYGLSSFKKHWKLISATENAEQTVEEEVKPAQTEKKAEDSKKKVEKPTEKKPAKKSKKADGEAIDTVQLVASVLDELGIEHKDVEKGLSVANNIKKRVFEVWKRNTRVRINLNPEMLEFKKFNKKLASTIGPSTNPNSKLTVTMYVDLEFISEAIKNLCELIYEFEEEDANEEA